MKAFLSHWSGDKNLVSAVADELGRQYCIVDTFSFDTAIEFGESIRRGLEKSSVFVLFASRIALTRDWVKYEIADAERAHLHGTIRRVIVYIIDTDVQLESIPDWLRRGLVRQILSPKVIARDLRHHMNELVRHEQHPFFIGRSDDLRRFESALYPSDDRAPPRSLFVWGLEGVGRRTLLKRAVGDVLDLPKLCVLRVEEGDDIVSLNVKLAAETEPFVDQDSIKLRLSELKMMSDDSAHANFINNATDVNSNREALILMDAGGLLDNEGRLVIFIRNILTDLQTKSLYCFMISRRRPLQDNTDAGGRIPDLRVNALPEEEARKLLRRLGDHYELALTSAQIEELSSYVRGYPPAAYFACQLARDYGVEIVLSQKSQLVEFRVSLFIKFLEADEKLDSKRLQILANLALYSPLPLPILGRLVKSTPEELNFSMGYLIDSALVSPDSRGHYWLSEPVVDAVHRISKGTISVDHRSVAQALEEYLAELDEPERTLELRRSLYRAMLYGRAKSISCEQFDLVSDLIAVTIRFYHDQDYENAIDCGRLAVEQRPFNTKAREFLVRALIQVERFDDALDHISILQRQARYREAFFLRGFLERKRENQEEAVKAYLEALARGRRGVAIHRELAMCYFQLGDLVNARKHIDIAQEAEGDNRYVIDLQIQIATKQRDENAARTKLRLLSSLDQRQYYLHRLSTVEFAFGQREAAYDAAHNAVAFLQSIGKRSTFAQMTQLAKCAMTTGRFVEAGTTIAELERRFPAIRKDIKVGLRCRWCIAQGYFEEAASLWESLEDKTKPVHLGLRRDILEGLINGNHIEEERLNNMKRELRDIESAIANYEFDIIVDEEFPFDT
ncbi:MAG TPA: TIR domain-containing protein [Geminicoccaceae bacterium]|nr:TIR domain-containing protein [Geminicoccaceae bacterium]